MATTTSDASSACTDLIETPGVSPETQSAAYAMRALSHSLKGAYDTAIRDYDVAIRIVPDFAVALNNRAWAYFKSGRAAMGKDDVEKSLALDPSSPHTYDTRAHIKQWTGQPAAALADYERAMAFGGQRMIRLYQCGLAAAGLYKGPADGNASYELRRAMEALRAGHELRSAAAGRGVQGRDVLNCACRHAFREPAATRG